MKTKTAVVTIFGFAAVAAVCIAGFVLLGGSGDEKTVVERVTTINNTFIEQQFNLSEPLVVREMVIEDESSVNAQLQLKANDTGVASVDLVTDSSSASFGFASFTAFLQVMGETRMLVTSELFRIIGPFANVNPNPPLNNTSPCATGTQAFDENFEYRCIANNVWKRIPYDNSTF